MRVYCDTDESYFRVQTANHQRLKIDITGLATFAGNIIVNGGNIGITADTDLLQLSSGALTVNGTIDINTIAAGTSDYDKFLVSDGGVVKFRTGAQVLSDIGGAVVNPVATDTIWDAAGDIIYGTGSNTGARLAKGTATQVLTMNAGATAPEWATGGVGDASVTQAKLKTSQGSVSIAVALSSSGITASLPGGEYGFTLQTKGTDSWVGLREWLLRL